MGDANQKTATPPALATDRDLMGMQVLRNSQYSTPMAPVERVYWLESLKESLMAARLNSIPKFSKTAEQTDTILAGIIQLENDIKVKDKVSLADVEKFAPKAEIDPAIRAKSVPGGVDVALALMEGDLQGAHKMRGIVSSFNPSGEKRDIILPPPDRPGNDGLEKSGEGFNQPSLTRPAQPPRR